MTPGFRRVLAAEAVSNFGAMLSRVAIPWVAALVLNATPFEVGLLLVADVAAGALGGLALGTLVDARGTRVMMVATDMGRAAVLAAIALLAWSGHLALWMLVACAAASGVLTIAFELARSSWMAQRVVDADLPKANARLSFVMSVSETVAFALGGWIYQALGAALALAIDAASYALSALLLRGTPETPVRVDPELKAGWDGFKRRTREGVDAIRASPALRRLALVNALVALGVSLAGTSYMIFVARDLAFTTGLLGLIFAVGGLGALAGAALAPWAGERLGAPRAMAAGLLLLAIGAACIPLAPGATVLGVALLVAHQLVGDAGHALFNVHDRTTRQRAVAPHLLARADAGLRTVWQLAMLAGALGGGVLATAFGTRWALAISALLYAGACVVMLWSPRTRSSHTQS